VQSRAKPGHGVPTATQRRGVMHNRAVSWYLWAMVAFIIILVVIGFIVGMLARLLVPGRDNIGIIGTILLGIVGSFVGGFLWELVEYHTIETSQFHSVGIIGSILGAVVVLLILRATGLERGRSRRRL
jgi:uncharacterized membrane protein YeaQ/YmgE (transglycosylase-associated protein family)